MSVCVCGWVGGCLCVCDIGKCVILAFSVLQDHSPAVRKWLSLFLMAV